MSRQQCASIGAGCWMPGAGYGTKRWGRTISVLPLTTHWWVTGYVWCGTWHMQSIHRDGRDLLQNAVCGNTVLFFYCFHLFAVIQMDRWIPLLRAHLEMMTGWFYANRTIIFLSSFSHLLLAYIKQPFPLLLLLLH
jgi:hypothetical protein